MVERTSPTMSEAALEPELAVVDAHHHMWRKPPDDYLFPELLDDLDCGHRVLATVYVEGGSLHRPINSGGTMYRAQGPDLLKPVGETEYANGVAAMAASGLFGTALACAGIIGFVDLPEGRRVEAALEAHMRFPRFKGVRHITGWDDDPALRNPVLHLRDGLFRDDGFRDGLALLQSLGLLFETTCFHPQLKDLAEAAMAFPDLTIVVCHLGYPINVGRFAGRPDEAFDDWRSNLAALAACPNIILKAGGLLSPRSALVPTAGPGKLSSAAIEAMLSRHIHTAVDLFGPERIVFESNFPVDGKCVRYGTLWNAYKLLTRRYSSDERAAMLSGNARRVYSLDIEGDLTDPRADQA